MQRFCGTATQDHDTIIMWRREEARRAAESLGATFHEPLVDDLDLFYERLTVRRLGSVVRAIAPDIVLLSSPQDYMEDHMNACRVAVTALFCRGMRNFPAVPQRAPIDKEVTLYHALPWGLRDSLRRSVFAGQYVDIGSVLEEKSAALACHTSQKEWLDASQGSTATLPR